MGKRKLNKKSGEEWRPEFEAALAASFAEFACPPVPYRETSFGEWVDIVLSIVGRDVTPGQLAGLSKSDIVALAQKFGARFGCKAPNVVQIKTAIAHTFAMARWPQIPMILRLSQKLCTKIKAGSLKTMPLDDNPFADWSAHLFVADRTQYIIVSNTKSLYSTVLFGKGITNDSHFIECVLGSIREFMEDDGQAFVYHRFIAPTSGTVSFAKALNRSVTASMNELIRFATALLVEDELSPHDVGFKLNDFLLSAIASSKSDKYGKPREAFKNLVNGIKE